MKVSEPYLVFNVGLLGLVQVDLEEPGAVEADAGPLANNLGGVDQIVQEGVVDRDQSAGARPLLLQLVLLPGGLGQDLTLGNEDNVLAGELLLQLADQPDLDLLEGLELRHWHEHNDGLLALADLDLLGGADEQLTELSLQVRAALELHQSVADGLLALAELSISGLLDFGVSSHLKEIVEYPSNRASDDQTTGFFTNLGGLTDRLSRKLRPDHFT